MFKRKKNNQINEFETFVSQGDWKGYKNLVSRKNDVLYSKFKSRLSLIKKFDNLLTSQSMVKRAYGKVLLLIHFLLIYGLSFIITNNQLTQCTLLATVPIIIIQIPLLFIFLRQSGLSRTKTWLYLLPKGALIIGQHGFYVCKILGKLLLKNGIYRTKNLAIYIFRVISWNYTISSFYVLIVYWLFKDLQFEQLSTLWLLLLPFAIFYIMLSHYFLHQTLLNKLKFALLNKLLTRLFFFLMSFVTFYALLQLYTDYDDYRALKIKGIVLAYSFVLIFFELIFSDRNFCCYCDKEL